MKNFRYSFRCDEHVIRPCSFATTDTAHAYARDHDKTHHDGVKTAVVVKFRKA